MEYALVNIVLGDGPDAPNTQKNQSGQRKSSKAGIIISQLLGEKVV